MLDGGAGVLWLQRLTMRVIGHLGLEASLAQLAEHALRKRMVVGSIPTGGLAVTSVSYLLILSSEASVPYAATCFDGYSCSCLVWFLGAPVV